MPDAVTIPEPIPEPIADIAWRIRATLNKLAENPEAQWAEILEEAFGDLVVLRSALGDKLWGGDELTKIACDGIPLGPPKIRSISDAMGWRCKLQNLEAKLLAAIRFLPKREYMQAVGEIILGSNPCLPNTTAMVDAPQEQGGISACHQAPPQACDVPPMRPDTGPVEECLANKAEVQATPSGTANGNMLHLLSPKQADPQACDVPPIVEGKGKRRGAAGLHEWGKIRMSFNADDSEYVRITRSKKTVKCPFSEIGFSHKGTLKPKKCWHVLRMFAAQQGELPPAQKKGEREAFRAAVKRTNRILREHFELESSPIEFDRKRRVWKMHIALEWHE